MTELKSLPVRVTPDLLVRVDAVRPDLTPREPFVRHLIDIALKQLEGADAEEQLKTEKTAVPDEEGSSGWKVLYNRATREVRISPSGIVVVEDRVGKQIRHTRIYPDGRHAQVVEDSPQKAWLAARKQAK